VAATLAAAERLGGRIIQPEQRVPGTSFGVFADAQGHRIGVAANG
jgi:predicted enzyme related to lactoylglutathione lyase